MKRYLLFGWKLSYVEQSENEGYWLKPKGGWYDFLFDINDIDELKSKISIIEKLDNLMIVDTTLQKDIFTGVIFYENNIQYYKKDLYLHIINNLRNETTYFSR